MKKCNISGCDNEAGPRTETCQNCRSAKYYWGNKRPAQIVERRRKLNLYGERLDTFFNLKEDGSVDWTKKKRAKR